MHCSRASRSSAARPEQLHNRAKPAGPPLAVAPEPWLQATRGLPQQAPRPRSSELSKQVTGCVVDRAGLRRVQRDLFCARGMPGPGRCEWPCRSLGRGVGSLVGARGAAPGGRLPEGPPSGAIAHIKLTTCRWGVSTAVSETHAVTPVTCRGPCCRRRPCARCTRPGGW